MIGSIRTIAMAAGAVGVAGTATYVGVTAPSPNENETVVTEPDDGFELCLETGIAFFEGVEAGCYSRTEIADWRDRPLVDRSNEALSVKMTHPSDYTVDPVQCSTCRDFYEMSWQGWFALSSRDIRREAYFVRACGVLKMLMKAEPASENFFPEDGSREDDMAALGAERILRVGSDPEADPDALDTESADAASAEGLPEPDLGWRLSSAGQESRVEEVATADFDGDGVAEILTFLTASVEDGTASVSSVALLEKDSADAEIVLTPLAFANDGETPGEGT